MGNCNWLVKAAEADREALMRLGVGKFEVAAMDHQEVIAALKARGYCWGNLVEVDLDDVAEWVGLFGRNFSAELEDKRKEWVTRYVEMHPDLTPDSADPEQGKLPGNVWQDGDIARFGRNNERAVEVFPGLFRYSGSGMGDYFGANRQVAWLSESAAVERAREEAVRFVYWAAEVDSDPVDFNGWKLRKALRLLQTSNESYPWALDFGDSSPLLFPSESMARDWAMRNGHQIDDRERKLQRTDDLGVERFNEDDASFSHFSVCTINPATKEVIDVATGLMHETEKAAKVELQELLATERKLADDADASEVTVPAVDLACVLDMAKSHIEDIETGVDEGIYDASDNGDLPRKQTAVHTIEHLHRLAVTPAVRSVSDEKRAVEVFRGYFGHSGTILQVDFVVPVNATAIEKDAAYLAALAQQADINYLAVGDEALSSTR